MHQRWGTELSHSLNDSTAVLVLAVLDGIVFYLLNQIDQVLICLIFAHNIKYFLNDMISIEVIAALFDSIVFCKLSHH